MGSSKKHKKHSRSRETVDDTPVSMSETPKGIKLVLKMGGGGGSSPAPGPSPLVAYSSTVPAPTTLIPNSYRDPSIAVRLVHSDSIASPSPDCISVKKIENHLLNGSIASDSMSESSHHNKQHKKSSSSDKKKKKKKKKHHHHCHHHKDKEHHHKHHHSSSNSHAAGDKRKERPGEDEEDENDEYDVERIPKKPRPPAVTETVDNQTPLPQTPLRSPVGVITSPKQVTENSSLQKLLITLLELLRKRDTYEFFAWPVNDAIAPGYSTIISKPMDFSTIRRKLENRQYENLETFKSDVKLICDNATTYNRPETIYYKEARKLWRNAQKILSKEHIIQLDPEFKYIGSLTVQEVGFDLRAKTPVEELTPRVTRNRIRTGDEEERPESIPPMKISLTASATPPTTVKPDQIQPPVAPVVDVQTKDPVVSARATPATVTIDESPVIERLQPEPPKKDTPTAAKNIISSPEIRTDSSPGMATKSCPKDNDPVELGSPADDAPASEILEHAQRMARGAASKLALLKPCNTYSFLRQDQDGTTTLNFLNPDVTLTDKYIGNRPPEYPVPPKKVDLEMLIGKLPYGMQNLLEIKDEARSIAKPLNYLPLESCPPFSTYAPHYDSTFSNLTKSESDLVYSTYGDEVGVQYADSIMHFAKDCDYVMTMVDNILDTLTNGEHKKTLEKLKTGELLRTDQESDQSNSLPEQNGDIAPKVNGEHSVNSTSHASITVQVPMPPIAALNNDIRPEPQTNGQTHQVNGNGIATEGDRTIENEQRIQSKLLETSTMIQRLSKLQKDRLSQPPPANLANVPGIPQAEADLANKVAAALSEIASHAKPGSVVSVDAIRRAIGVSLPDRLTSTTGPTADHLADST